jgi:hypothetical protein
MLAPCPDFALAIRKFGAYTEFWTPRSGAPSMDNLAGHGVAAAKEDEMKFVNPFKYSLKSWTFAYAKAVAVFIVIVASIGVLGYGICAEPLKFSAVCDAAWFQNSFEWISRVVGNVLPYVIKAFVIAYVVKIILAIWSALSGSKGKRPASRPARRK